MKLSRKRLSRIRRMRHQTRKSYRRPTKKGGRRRRRSFRRNNLDMSNRTLRVNHSGCSIMQYGGKGVFLNPLFDDGTAKAVNVMRLPIIHLNQLLDRLNMFIIPPPDGSRTVYSIVYNGCCTKEKMSNELNTTISLLNRANKEMSSRIYTSEMTKEERKAFSAYVAVLKAIISVLNKWNSSKNKRRSKREGYINWRDVINPARGKSSQVGLLFIKRYLELFILALEIFYNRLYQVEEDSRASTLKQYESALIKKISTAVTGQWSPANRAAMIQELEKLWKDDKGACHEFTLDNAVTIWRVATDYVKAHSGSDKAALYAMAVRNIFTILDSKADILSKNAACESHSAVEAKKKITKRIKHAVTSKTSRERLPNLYMSLLVQSLGILWGLGGTSRLYAYMFFPEFIQKIINESDENELTLYKKKQEIRIHAIERIKRDKSLEEEMKKEFPRDVQDNKVIEKFYSILNRQSATLKDAGLRTAMDRLYGRRPTPAHISKIRGTGYGIIPGEVHDLYVHLNNKKVFY